MDLVPILSYLVLRGRCRSCGSTVSLQYPLVEFGTGAIFLLTFLIAPIPSSVWHSVGLVALLAFWASFILIVVVDLRHTLIPLRFAYMLIGSAVFVRIANALLAGSFAPLTDGLLGAFAFGGGIAAIVLLTRGKGMGSGDVYVALAVGMFFGLVRGLEVAALSFWIGALVGFALMMCRKGVRMKTELPFAPFMFAAALIGAFTPFSPYMAIALFLYPL